MANQWSAQQQSIFEWFRNPERKRAVVRARAGTGKTTTIIAGLSHAPEQRMLLCAFNKRIADELSRKISTDRAEAKTLHGVGFAYIRRNWENVRVDGSRGKRLALEACGGSSAPDAMVALVARLAGLLKEMAPGCSTVDEALSIAEDMDCLPDEDWEDDGWTAERVARLALRARDFAARKDGTVDFSDMLWLPLRHGWARGKWDLVVVDECFPAPTPVLLADGTTLPIGQIVEQRLPVTVLSYDEATGKQVQKRVVDWKKVPAKKPTIRITVRQVGYGSDGKRLSPATERVRFGTRHLVCTEDHRIWTTEGWVEAKHLKAGQRVQVESGAPRDLAYNAKYKHTTIGKQALREGISQRNATGRMVGKPNPNGPKVRGGNGTGLTVPQSRLLAALGPSWQAEYRITTGARHLGHPHTYSVDIAHPGCRIAVEVDGSSHNGKRAQQDARKDAFLRGMGWQVFRFSNVDAAQRAEEIAASLPQNCPVEGEVLSVESFPIEDYSVYDLTVEDTHCYYAHGILVHNCQDMNAAQIELALKSVTKTGRVIVVGDDRQAIYGFRGADSGSLDRLRAAMGAEELPLTTTYRCPKAVVAEAQRLVPDYNAAPTAPAGEIHTLPVEKLAETVAPGDFVLSRKNAPLVRVCLSILRTGTRAKVEGKDVGKGLVALLKKLKPKSMPDFLAKLTKWEAKETKRAANLKKETAERKTAEVADQAETLRVLADGLSGVAELETRIETLFADDAAGNKSLVVCSSVHRSKGLEAPRVFILRSTLGGRKPKEGKAPAAPSTEEANIEYVAITRAQTSLHWVEGDV